jgi:hypothetical protein
MWVAKKCVIMKPLFCYKMLGLFPMPSNDAKSSSYNMNFHLHPFSEKYVIKTSWTTKCNVPSWPKASVFPKN